MPACLSKPIFFDALSSESSDCDVLASFTKVCAVVDGTDREDVNFFFTQLAFSFSNVKELLCDYYNLKMSFAVVDFYYKKCRDMAESFKVPMVLPCVSTDIIFYQSLRYSYQMLCKMTDYGIDAECLCFVREKLAELESSDYILFINQFIRLCRCQISAGSRLNTITSSGTQKMLDTIRVIYLSCDRFLFEVDSYFKKQLNRRDSFLLADSETVSEMINRCRQDGVDWPVGASNES